MFKKILIANRGEIALRIMRSVREMGIKTVAVFSDPDKNSPFTRLADEAVRIGPGPSKDSYLDQKKILESAKKLPDIPKTPSVITRIPPPVSSVIFVALNNCFSRLSISL